MDNWSQDHACEERLTELEGYRWLVPPYQQSKLLTEIDGKRSTSHLVLWLLDELEKTTKLTGAPPIGYIQIQKDKSSKFMTQEDGLQ
ncbi:hypothetical protein P7K49_018429 [Saguinus oedipus]|uniref:Uncharacterized protein n=1 Tax=Saguinus oedipus TaxID=9490 RepID=A0ABQ9V7D2_SAGOE|nr:hypothetical protein P7K49_018429 [Saguinus oedipus]